MWELGALSEGPTPNLLYTIFVGKIPVMSEHQTSPRCMQIPHKKTHTRFQATIFLVSFSTPHNALVWSCTDNAVKITSVPLSITFN